MILVVISYFVGKFMNVQSENTELSYFCNNDIYKVFQKLGHETS